MFSKLIIATVLVMVALGGCRQRCTELSCQGDNDCVANEVCDFESGCCIEDTGE